MSPVHSKWWSNVAKNALRRIGLLLPTGLPNLEVCRAIGPITPGGWLGTLTLFLVGLCPTGRHPFVRLALDGLAPIRRLVFCLARSQMRDWTADLQLFVTFRLRYVKRFLGRDRQIKDTSRGACGRGPFFLFKGVH